MHRYLSKTVTAPAKVACFTVGQHTPSAAGCRGGGVPHAGKDDDWGVLGGAVCIADRAAPARGGRGDGYETAAFTSAVTLFSTAVLHFCSAYETGHRSPSSRWAASWKPRVEYR